MESWLRDRKTRRHYRIDDSRYCIVQNEYQEISCPHCHKKQFGRLTHFWFVSKDPKESQMASHNNYSSNLDELEELLVQYGAKDNKEPITERQVDGKWILEKDGRPWGTDYKPSNQS